MAWIPFSAFDPIFFLHHAMVDRVFALWQVLNPDSWVLPTASALASYTTAQGEIQGSQTLLTPFYKTYNGTFWTSDDVRDMGVFGYTYDDMTEFSRESLMVENATAQARAAVLINRLYGSSSPASLGIIGQDGGDTKRSIRKSTRGVDAPLGRWIDERSKDHHTAHDAHLRPWSLTGTKRPPPPPVVVNSEYREWVANIHAKKQALNSTFFIDLFLGDLPTDTTTWVYASNLVGTMSVFASPGGAMAGMGMSAGHTSGTIPLTFALAQKVSSGELASLNPEDAEPYLLQNLHYGIIMADGAVVAPEDVAGLGIMIVSSCVQVPSSAEELPRWGAVEDHFGLI
jgi:tyrosinase